MIVPFAAPKPCTSLTSSVCDAGLYWPRAHKDSKAPSHDTRKRQQVGGGMLQKLGEHVRGQLYTGDDTRRLAGTVVLGAAVGIAYFLAARLGLALLTEHVAVFWPAAGVAAGTLLALGRWARAPVAVAVMLASLVADLMGDRNVWAGLSFALCNTGEALLPAWLIERLFGPAFRLENLRQVLGLLAAAAVTSAAAAAAAMNLFGPSTAPLLTIWRTWFAADALGIVTVAPLLVELRAACRGR